MLKALSKICEACKIAAAAHKAMRNGCEVQITAELPVLKTGSGYGWTPESCTLSWCDPETERAAKQVFCTFPEEVRHSMAFVPKAGEFCDRARYWQNALRLALTAEQYYEAMRAIYEAYKRVKWIHTSPEKLIAFQTAWNEFTHASNPVYDPADYVQWGS